MKLQPYLLFVFCIIISTCCLAETTTLSGTVKNKNIKKVRIGLFTNNIEIIPENHIAEVKNGIFNVSFDLEKATWGFIYLEDTTYNVFISPGKQIKIVTDGNQIIFKGGNANENTFLVNIGKSGIWDYKNYDIHMHPDSVYKSMRSKRAYCLNLFAQANKKHPFSTTFTRFFKAEDACRFNSFLIQFPLAYAGEHKILLNDKILNQYKHPIKYYCNDNYVNCPGYIPLLLDAISKKASYLSRLKNIPYNRAQINIFTDSLTGKTRDYIMGYGICATYLIYNNPDTLLAKAFFKNATDKFAIVSVKKIISNYNYTINIKNKPLPDKIKNTILIDTANKEISLGNLVEQHKGHIMYIDVWSYFCLPCRAEMPFSKKLSDEYKGSDIDFISFISDTGKELKPWDEYFSIAGHKNNHYRLKNGFDAGLIKELFIMGNPAYIIIGKKGEFIEREAPRPSEPEKLKPLLNNLLTQSNPSQAKSNK